MAKKFDIPKCDLAALLSPTASGEISLSVVKSQFDNKDGIVINVRTNLNDAKGKPEVNTSAFKQFFYVGTPTEIKTQVESELGLGLLFK